MANSIKPADRNQAGEITVQFRQRLSMALLTLARVLSLPVSELATQDIAAINLACAEGLSNLSDTASSHCLATLDTWAEIVRAHTARLLPQFCRAPSSYRFSEAYFRALDMITVLQRDLGVRYRASKISVDTPFEPPDCFIYGIVCGSGGTCATLAVLYAAVGRRLGYPLKLVYARGAQYHHLFVRWDALDASAEFNIEATNLGMSTPPDDHYRKGMYTNDALIEKEEGFLKSMTVQEELACFLVQRAYCWLDKGSFRNAANSLGWACALVPQSVLLRNCLIAVLNSWGARLEQRKPAGFSEIVLRYSTRRFRSSLPWDLERDILGLEAMEDSFGEPAAKHPWAEGAHLSTCPSQLNVCSNCDSNRTVSNC